MNISPKNLAEFKKLAKNFYIMYEALVEYWNRKEDENQPDSYPIATTINVLVQNVQFSSVECVGYDHQREVNKVDSIVKLLKIMYDYDKSYMSLLPYNTISNLWDYASQNEFLNNDSPR